MLHIDSDNALGSPRGDVDDAYAFAALIAARADIAAISSCAGNTSAELAYANNVRLAEILGWPGPVVRRPDLRDFTGRIVALGPLTNVAGARRAAEIICVGGNSVSRGRWPPLWPYEFNLTHDRAATLDVFHSGVPLTIFPLDVARRLFVLQEELNDIPGVLGQFLREGSLRWFAFLRRRRFTRRFAIYDLAAALYAIDPDGFTLEQTTAEMRPNTALRFRRGTRPVTLCVDLDRERLWHHFLDTVRAYHSPP